MEIHIRTLVFVVMSLLGSLSLPWLVGGVPAADPSGARTLPTPTPVPLRGLSGGAEALARRLMPPEADAAAMRPPGESTTSAIVRTVGANLNVRSGPGLEHAIVGSAPPGAALTVIAASADGQWLRVERPDGDGWVFGALVEMRATSD